MFAVIFLVQPKPGHMDAYLDLAKVLKPSLEKIEGFIANERFGSRRAEGRLLSLSTWRDEKALIRWRTLAAHHQVQEKGRFEIFADYRLRVGEIVADTHLPKGHVLREQRFDATEVGEAKIATISELTPTGGTTPTRGNLAADLGLPSESSSSVIDQEVFESIYNPGKLLLLAMWKDPSVGNRWEPRAISAGDLRHRRVRIIRDYGMMDRREAPQYYPPVPE